jgi:predicted DNA-binding transcriptional regulator YafY
MSIRKGRISLLMVLLRVRVGAAPPGLWSVAGGDAKLEQVLPSRLRYRVRALGAATVPLTWDASPTVDPELLTVLAAAVAGGERLRFAYRATDGTHSRRLAEPHRLLAAGVTGKAFALAPTYRAVATLHAPAADVARRLGDYAGDLEPIDEHTCRLRSHTDTLEWLALRLAMLGCEFQVQQPPELAEYLRALGGRVTRAAGDVP